MTFPLPLKRWAALSGAMLSTISLLGCGETDLKGYRPASDHASRADRQNDSRSDRQSGDVSTTGQPNDELVSQSKIFAAAGDSEKSPERSSFEMTPVSALVPVNVVDSVRGLMTIPVNDTSIAPGSNTTNVNEALSAAEPRQIQVLIKDKKFQTESKTGALRVSFDDLDLLKVLNMDPVVDNAVDMMPDWLRNLDGKTIRVRGFMYPTYDTEGIERFVLARDNQICCFGRDPKIYDLIQVDMKSGKTTNYIPATRAFDVVGKFKIKLLTEDGKPYGLYVIEDAAVIDR